MAYIDIYTLSKEEQLLSRLAVAVADVSRDVFAESTNTAGYQIRRSLVAYAGPRTQDFRRFAEEIALVLLVLNPTLTKEGTDAQLKAAVAAIWTPYASIMERKNQITDPTKV